MRCALRKRTLRLHCANKGGGHWRKSRAPGACSPADISLAGDWDGRSSPGVYRPTLQRFYLSNQVTNGLVYGDYALLLGNPGDVPFVGDWTAQGHAGVGVFRPTNGLIYLKNGLTSGYADIRLVCRAEITFLKNATRLA